MATIVVSKDCIAVKCEEQVLTVSTKETKSHVLELPLPIKNETENKNRGKEYSELKPSNAYVTGVDVSRCNKWLAMCCSYKELSLWDVSCWTCVSSRRIMRSANRVKFTPSSNDIVVADKSGDAYVFSVKNPLKEGLLILGHLSMLLDVLISDDEKFIVTCDRDEKIRISHFPNAYNIQSYCLGHREFVSCLSFLPHDKTILVSGSGDGSVKFWNYVPGIFLHEINCNQYLKSNEDGSRELGNLKSTSSRVVLVTHDFGKESEVNSAVMHVSCCIIGDSSLLGVSLTHFKGCLIYKVNGVVDKISHSIVEVVLFESEPWDMHLSNDGILWYLSCKEKEPLSAVYFDNCGKIKQNFKHSETITKILNLVNSHSEKFASTAISERMSILYKRKFDNVQEYLERKKIRLSAL